METTVATGIEYTYDKNEVDKKITSIIEKIESVIITNNYQVTGDIEEFYVLEWKNFSKNQMKKIQKYCFWIDNRPTLKRINTFLGLLSRLFDIKRVHVKISLKEEKIRKLRTEWLNARYTAENALARYKNEKGDFYKN